MKRSNLIILGNVLDVLEGRVQPELLKPTADLNFRFALGGGTFSDEHCIGETLVIEGVTHISWMQHGKIHTDRQPNAMSPFLMGIKKGEPAGILFSVSSPITVEAFYTELFKKYPKGVALAGSAEMVMLEGVYLKKSPIYHENINTHHDTYWSSIDKIPHAKTFLFGVITPLNLFKKGFYHNPNETNAQPFDNHTHIALLDHLEVKMVYHMLTQSILQKGNFTLFPF